MNSLNSRPPINSNKTILVAFFSLLVSLMVLLLKGKAYYTTHSVAVLSDALETVINVITALIALYAVKASAEPADEEHPYGHGKFEYFSAAFEGGLVFFAALAIIFHSIESFFIENKLQNLSAGNMYLISATALNFSASLLLAHYGKRQNSEALKASSKHIMSDVLTTIGVIAGLYLADWTGIIWIDSAIGLLMGLWLISEAYKILRTNSGALLDEADQNALVEIAVIINKYKTSAIIDIHNVRMIRSGNFHHIDAHMVVPEFWDVSRVHLLTHEFEKNVVNDYKYDGEFAFHIDPCKRSFCKKCSVENCLIRKSEFEKTEYMSKEHLVKGAQYTN